MLYDIQRQEDKCITKKTGYCIYSIQTSQLINLKFDPYKFNMLP